MIDFKMSSPSGFDYELTYLFRNTMYDCKAPLSRFYYPDTRRIINAFIIIIIIMKSNSVIVRIPIPGKKYSFV